MKCYSCNIKLHKTIEKFYRYLESGLSNIYLKNIEIKKCHKCGEELTSIPNIEGLHNLIATTIAHKKYKLLPEEIRFLRTHLGFSSKDFAQFIGVTPETVTRWEKGSVNMKDPIEKLLRVLIIAKAGPFRNYEDLNMFSNKKIKQKKVFTFKSSWKEAA